MKALTLAIPLLLHVVYAEAGALRIEHVTVVSPERSRPMPDATVIVENARIVAVTASDPRRATARASSDVEVIDASGLYLSPGLIDSHVHTSDMPGMVPAIERAQPQIADELRKQMPRSFLYFGYTTLVDVISTADHVREWNAHPLHPDLYFCGAVPIPGGYPQTYQSIAEQIQQFPYLVLERGKESNAPAGLDPATHTPEAVVARMKKDGARCVKTFYERGFTEVDMWPAPRLETIRSLVEAAHASNMPVLIHANSTDGQEFALESGADIVAHGLWHWHGEQQQTQLTARVRSTLDNVVKARKGWQPTMRVLGGQVDLFDPDFLSDTRLERVVPARALAWYRTRNGQWFHDALAPAFLPKAILDLPEPVKAFEAVRSLSKGFIIAAPIARNTAATRYLAAREAKLLFATDTPGSPTYANQPGLNGFLEMRLLEAAGLTPLQIFRAATLTNAEALGILDELGTVQAGKRANLLLTRADPSRTIQAYDDIVKVIVAGQSVDRETLAANSPR